jgi:diguanylate cyclase (GGDEF)-like protein/putative nucleotidyltransferase with HDIG domain
MHFGAFLAMAALLLVYRSYHGYLALLQQQKAEADSDRVRAEDTSALHLRTIQALALAIEAKDHVTQTHLNRVSLYAADLGRGMGMSERDIEALKAAALLHDVGKLAVPEHILSKPGSLTPEEFEKMKIHTTVGAEIVESVGFPYPVAPMVRGHHENWDGSGYPDRLRGEQIPLGARILAVVDSLDSLMSPRQYRAELPLREAMAYIASQSGRRYDPRIVELLSYRLHDLEEMVSQSETKAAAQPTEQRILPEEFIGRIGAARNEAQVLFELSQAVGTTLRLDSALAAFISNIQKLLPFHTAALYQVHEDAVIAECCLGEEAGLFSTLSIPLGQGLSGWVVEHGTPILNGNPSVESGYKGDEARFSNLRSALVVPLKGDNGIVGALALYSQPKDGFTKDHLRVVLAASSTLGTVIENVRRYREAEESAGIDFLTELPNARALATHLERELQRSGRSHEAITVMVGDLDGFKQVNDKLGHLVGNQVLQQVAVALKAQARSGDFVARMGGDEFALVLTGLPMLSSAEAVIRFTSAVERAVAPIANGHPVSLSLGVARYGMDGETSRELLDVADRRMYESKARRKVAERAESIRATEPAPRPYAVNE